MIIIRAMLSVDGRMILLAREYTGQLQNKGSWHCPQHHCVHEDQNMWARYITVKLFRM